MINKDSLSMRINNISKENNIDANILYSLFFFDSFLSRLAISKYKDKFILKGGLYLSSLLGIENRSTMDMDFLIKKIKLEENQIIGAVKEVLSLDIHDGVTYLYLGISRIKQDDMYGGYSVKLQGRLSNIQQIFSLDIVTGDPIIPSERNFEYKCLLTNQVLDLKTYSLESVLAEKIETILEKGIQNSRSKDFYDVYYVYLLKKKICLSCILSKLLLRLALIVRFRSLSVKRKILWMI